MKLLTKVLSVGAVLIGSAPFALAIPLSGSIGVGGSDTFTSNSITFVNPGIVLATSNSFSTFMGQTATLGSFNFDSSAAGTTLITTTDMMGDVLKFVITGITAFGPNAAILVPNVAVTGTGTFSNTAPGYTSTPGTFSLTTSTTGLTTFQLNGTATPPVPEPSSLILLGTGLLSAAGTVLRKRRMA